MTINKLADVIPAVLALMIMMAIIIDGQAPWMLIALYWMCVAVRNWGKAVGA